MYTNPYYSSVNAILTTTHYVVISFVNLLKK